MLSEFLGIGQQFLLKREIFFLGAATAPCAGQRAGGDHAVFEAHQNLGAGTDDLEVAEVEEEQIR